MSKKESTTLTLLMSGFSTNHPMVVIRPKNMANQRLLINYTGTAVDNKLTLEQVKQSLGILTRRYGKVEKLLTVRDFLGMVMNRSEIDNDFKIKVSHTKFSIMFGHGGKRYFIIPQKNDLDVLSFGSQHSIPPPQLLSRIDTVRPGVVRPQRPLYNGDALLFGPELYTGLNPGPPLTQDFQGTSINQELVIPPAIQSTIDNYLKDE